jgi:hypothetical protein
MAWICVVEAAFKLTKTSPLWYLCLNFHVVENVMWVNGANTEVVGYKQAVRNAGADAPLLHFAANA